ncbi:MAG: hypothetical protein WC413_02305 [Candidatus Nanoarchaeia archaeon]
MENLRELNLKLTAESLRKAIHKDIIIVQTIHSIDNLIAVISKLLSNLRERYGYYNSESMKIEDQKQLLNEIKKFKKGKVGIDLDKEDLNSVLDLVEVIEKLIDTKEKQEKYLETLMKKECPFLLETAGALVGARLISLANDLKHLAELPSSTIQVLGAEKALFRHLKEGARAPKFGVIYNHESISKDKNRGKAARHLAAKISIAVKKDYFRKK